jgi:hypothetical protein
MAGGAGIYFSKTREPGLNGRCRSIEGNRRPDLPASLEMPKVSMDREGVAPHFWQPWRSLAPFANTGLIPWSVAISRPVSLYRRRTWRGNPTVAVIHRIFVETVRAENQSNQAKDNHRGNPKAQQCFLPRNVREQPEKFHRLITPQTIIGITQYDLGIIMPKLEACRGILLSGSAGESGKSAMPKA